MKQKKPYIKINLDQENPLKTIAKMGKIPVIRRSKDGFHNYDQKEYFDHYSAKFKDTAPPKGCFCLLGGIFGHWKESLHIGFVELDTPVVDTYAFDDKLGWKWVTAKERYEDAMKTFIHDFNCGINTAYDLEDFELSEEAIIDSKYITHVATIKYEDYYKLIRFANDSMNTLFEGISLFDCIEFPEKLPENIQICLLFFTAVFDIYMNHFHMFFPIRPFDEYYLYHNIVEIIKYCRKYNYDYKLHDNMTNITVYGMIKSIDYDFILQSGNICEKQSIATGDGNVKYYNTYTPIEGPVDKI